MNTYYLKILLFKRITRAYTQVSVFEGLSERLRVGEKFGANTMNRKKNVYILVYKIIYINLKNGTIFFLNLEIYKTLLFNSGKTTIYY